MPTSRREREEDAKLGRRAGTVRLAHRLHRRRDRVREGLCLAEGPDAVRCAVRSGAAVHLLMTSDANAKHGDLIREARSSGVRTDVLTSDAMRLACEAATPQPIAALCLRREADPAELMGALAMPTSGRTRAVAVIAGCADPGNVGTIVRLVDAVDALGVAVTAGSADPWSPKAVRASTGSIFDVPVVGDVDAVEFIGSARARGIKALAASASGHRGLFDQSIAPILRSPVLWLFGNEAQGIADEVAVACDEIISIPIFGEVGSLNVACAASLCLYETARCARGLRLGPASGQAHE